MAPAFSGPQVSAGPYEDAEGVRYLVRLERVPGGLRLGEWAGSELRRRAPVLAAADLPGPAAEPGVSRGRAGDFREELRAEPLGGGRLRIGRWMLRPGGDWELRDAAPMLPAARYVEALADAAAKGALCAGATGR